MPEPPGPKVAIITGGGTTATGGNGGSGGGSGTTGSPDDLIPYLQQIINILASVLTAGQSKGIIEYYTIAAGGTSQLLFSSQKLVKKAIIINLSTDCLYLFSNGYEGGPIGVTAQGFPLNAASSGGLGGGSLPLGNVDLGTFSILGANTSDAYVVYYEI